MTTGKTSQPLDDDEAMNIRTSTVLVGIRGTCGWVEDRDGLSRVYLLEGTVECSAGDQTAQVNAGEMAELTVDGDLVLQTFTVQDIPAFVLDDLIQDSNLSSDIYEASGLDVLDTSEIAAGRDGQGEDAETFIEPEEDVAWSYNDGILTISGTGNMSYDLISSWSDYHDQIHTLIIDDGITSIGDFAFYDCSNLNSVTIPDGVTSIGDCAFY